MIDYSEDATSTWIAENLPLPETAVFVDVGCARPRQYSQTAFLRDMGWWGLAIDGNPAYGPEWQGENAKFIPAVISNEPEVNFLIEPTNTLVSRRHKTGELVQAETLEHILEENGLREFYFLALDIEGQEMEALLSMDLDYRNPRIIVAEFRSEHFGEDYRALHHLLRHGYNLVHLTHGNAVYYRP